MVDPIYRTAESRVAFSETQSPILSLLGSFRERVCEKRKVVVMEDV